MTSTVIDLDDTDRAILRALSADGTLSAGELGRRLGLSHGNGGLRSMKVCSNRQAALGDSSS